MVRLLVVNPDCAPCDSIHPLCCEGLVAIQKPFGILRLSESRTGVSELVNTEETIESLSQTREFYSDLNYTENQGVAAKAAAMAEAQTQPEDLPTVEDREEAETARMACNKNGHGNK